ncbi:MAG: hypothetical protein MJ204_06395 [Bacteroidales bacterium]|nr:hypothetical protein [Bacteroidales bacterium]
MSTAVSRHIARIVCVSYAILTTLICGAREYSVEELIKLPYDEITDTFIVPEGDVVTMTKSLTLRDIRKLAVYGTLIFNENVIGNGGKFDIYGSVILAAGKTITINSGPLNIHETGSLTCPGTFTNNAAGTVTVEGTITTKDFTNNGTATIAEGATVSTSNNFNNNSNLTLNGIVTTSNTFNSNNDNSKLIIDGSISAKSMALKGETTIANTADINITTTLTNNGTLTLPGDYNLTVTNITNNGTLTIPEGETLDIPGTITNNAGKELTIEGTAICKDFNNNGTATIADGATVTTSNNFNNNSNLTINGTVTTSNTFNSNNDNSKLIIDGSISAKSMALKGETTIANTADINITTTLTNNGTLTLPGDYNLTVTNITNNGTLTIPEGETLDIPGTITNNAGKELTIEGTAICKDFNNNGTATIADGATVTTSNNFNNNSNLTINGTVTATKSFNSNNATNSNLNIDGTISAKTLNVANVVTQGEHSQLNITASITNNAKTLQIPNDITLTGGITNNENGTLELSDKVTVTTKGDVKNYGTITIPSNATLDASAASKNFENFETGTIINNGTITAKGNVKNYGTITISSNATLDASTKDKNFENLETGTIINNGTILTYNLWNTGNIELISIDDGLANIQASHFYANVANGQQNNTDYTGVQGRLYISNGVLSVKFRFLVGDDVTILEDAGVIVDGDQTSYLLIYDMQHSSSAKNWLTVLNNSKLEIILGSDDNNGVAPGTAAFDNNPMQWEFVESPVMAGIDCENDLLDAPDGYNYYKVIPDIEIAGIGLSSSCLYFKVPQNIHIVGDVHRGGVTNTNEHSKDVGIVSINKGETTIDKTLAILLPILLTNFDVRQSGQAIEFNWTTASEINNDYFEIEYSYDGKNFNPLVWTQGAGTTTKEHDYSITVNNINDITGLVYFRLKQTDFDGKSSYSDVKILQVKSYEENLFIYPNPANTTITIAGEYDSVRFVDMNSKTINLPCSGRTSYSVESLSIGTYFAIISTKGSTKVLMFMKE